MGKAGGFQLVCGGHFLGIRVTDKKVNLPTSTSFHMETTRFDNAWAPGTFLPAKVTTDHQSPDNGSVFGFFLHCSSSFNSTHNKESARAS